ncbi:MAG: ribonuclease III [Bacteroidales bacterium]|nr:ribonuclease III [Bacteroidales bacterium]
MEHSEKEIRHYFKNIFGLRIHNLEPYRIALTHRSLVEKDHHFGKFNNERLEYLGDAILDAIIADYLFHKYPLETEGQLTQLRSKLVNRARLNKLAGKLGLHDMIRTGSHIQGGSIDGNALEAVIGAIYLDHGYKKTYKVLIKQIFLTHLDIESIKEEEGDFKSRMFIWAQRNRKKIRFVNKRSDSNQEHSFHSQILIGEEVVAESDGLSIKQAEQLASEKAWHLLNPEP